jgi:3-methylcrotonyl-CoA carboxylase alpha subunit
MSKKITRLMIANRGEIACRIVATARQMGIETVTIFASDDRDLPHASVGDFVAELKGKGLAETYLNIPQLLEIAKRTGADAIHPGYGFLSENAGFADAVVKAGLIFVGPPATCISAMGDKAQSRILCKEIGVPTIPGYDGGSTDIKLLTKEAEKIGYPILAKAAAGGGGKGMRIVERAADLSAALDSARSEAKNAFGDDRMLIEKYLVEPRHIELQVFSDVHGNHLHLYERECSIQRRHQKIVEESPAPNLPEKTRAGMIEAALKITKHINYVGAGTMEFILDREGNFYFLEMNTRLQVEHPVTEMVTSLDLVRIQIEVAEGKKLSVAQQDIVQRGHAIEVRLYAEDSERDFMPSPGTLKEFVLPHLPLTRCENGYTSGNTVSASYDPMIAKLVAWGETREHAIARMRATLGATRISGVTNNREFLLRILNHPAFVAGKVTTNFIKQHHEVLMHPKVAADDVARIAAAFLLFGDGASTQEHAAAARTEHSAWTKAAGMR